MSAAKITESTRKLTNWHQIQQRDRQAKEIMEREGCSFSEAWLRVVEGGK